MKSNFLKGFFGQSKPKKDTTDYVVSVFGTMNPKLIDALDDVITSQYDVRLFFSSMSYAIMFRSKHDIDFIQHRFKLCFDEDGSAFILSNVEDAKTHYVGSYANFMNLDDGNPMNTNTTVLKEFFAVLDNIKNKAFEEFGNMQMENGAMIIDLGETLDTNKPKQMNDSEMMDMILDKINKTGMSSLNSDELSLLDKISKSNGKKK